MSKQNKQKDFADQWITKQAAIDAARDWYEGLICGSFKGLQKRLQALPSVQPETCAYWDRESNFCALHRPSAQPDNRLERIADIVEGTIDHLDRDDAMDMLYQIKEVLK